MFPFARFPAGTPDIPFSLTMLRGLNNMGFLRFPSQILIPGVMAPAGITMASRTGPFPFSPPAFRLQFILHEIPVLYKSEVRIQEYAHVRCRDLHRAASIGTGLFHNAAQQFPRNPPAAVFRDSIHS